MCRKRIGLNRPTARREIAPVQLPKRAVAARQAEPLYRLAFFRLRAERRSGRAVKKQYAPAQATPERVPNPDCSCFSPFASAENRFGNIRRLLCISGVIIRTDFLRVIRRKHCAANDHRHEKDRFHAGAQSSFPCSARLWSSVRKGRQPSRRIASLLPPRGPQARRAPNQ